jgi:hypothetical protein
LGKHDGILMVTKFMGRLMGVVLKGWNTMKLNHLGGTPGSKKKYLVVFCCEIMIERRLCQ